MRLELLELPRTVVQLAASHIWRQDGTAGLTSTRVAYASHAYTGHAREEEKKAAEQQRQQEQAAL